MKLYNSKTRKLEVFKPFADKTVKMYVCGITPYDTTHLGHAFTYVFYDTLKRYLEYKGYKVIYTQNVTDIDDDILKKAKEVKKDWQELGEFWTKRFLEDMKTLNVASPTHYVKATDSIPTMIKIIENIIRQNIAYENQGNVYFDISKFEKYGQLSKLNKEQMLLIAKERGGNPNDPLKRNPLDFLLWQKAKPQEPSWQGPQNITGRPGWHIECSAMVCDYLDSQIDIHGGGHDLIFPHHESETAQSESYTHKNPFVKYWIHTGMVMFEGEKMSKSLGNLVMVKDLLKKYSPQAMRYILLSHCYRKPWEFEESELKTAEKTIKKFSVSLRNSTNKTHLANLTNEKNAITIAFEKALDDDLNTPKALEVLQKANNPTTIRFLASTLGIA